MKKFCVGSSFVMILCMCWNSVFRLVVVWVVLEIVYSVVCIDLLCLCLVMFCVMVMCMLFCFD